MTTIKERDRLIEEAWEEFADIPMDPETEKIEDIFVISIPEENCAVRFDPGTPRLDVWQWFDSHYSKGVASLLYGSGADSTMDIVRLSYRNLLCAECMSETCAFNPEGICMYPMVYGQPPTMTDDGCDNWVLANSADRENGGF